MLMRKEPRARSGESEGWANAYGIRRVGGDVGLVYVHYAYGMDFLLKIYCFLQAPLFSSRGELYQAEQKKKKNTLENRRSSRDTHEVSPGQSSIS